MCSRHVHSLFWEANLVAHDLLALLILFVIGVCAVLIFIRFPCALVFTVMRSALRPFRVRFRPRRRIVRKILRRFRKTCINAPDTPKRLLPVD
jgi:hypothetical protein